MQANKDFTPRSFDRRGIKTPVEQFAAELCRRAAVKYRGLQKGFGILPDQILFDNDHRSTLCIPVPGATVEAIRTLVAESNRMWKGAL
ncbi:MAG TPA: hypothetical protein VN025_05870 [Candidatus Dormibacteraeota bacterium]|jgi:hypothetical protein|nr:hypothetical protein [Candidatus Dormibacteraeota bacterium]